MRSLLLKALGQPFVVVHRSHSLRAACHMTVDTPNATDVTTGGR
jgi:hypothetical protein